MAKNPFSVEDHTILPGFHAQKLSASINVALGGVQEVVGRYTDEVASQPHPGSLPVGYRELVEVGKDVIAGKDRGKSLADTAVSGADGAS